MNEQFNTRKGERGGAGVKFLIIFVVILVVANAGYNYVPTAYDAEALKTEMSTAVMQGLALPGKMSPVDNVKQRIQKAILQNNIPPDAIVDVKQAGNVLTAHVSYNKKISILPFGIYTYDYKFDNTATPSGFLLKEMKE